LGVDKASEKPRPGREGIIRWKFWLFSSALFPGISESGSDGVVKAVISGPSDRFVKGNGGISKRGVASGSWDGIWMKWTRIGGDDVFSSGMAVRYCGMVLRYASWVRQE